jgi:hypothetical protein
LFHFSLASFGSIHYCTFEILRKGDYDLAITQYIKTIGRLEPSYVIKKFLDAQRIHNLTLYLQKLHEAGVANANHTTLLLNCYTKLKDLQKLDEFIKVKFKLHIILYMTFLFHSSLGVVMIII